jgi:hypothetical protein
MKNIESNHGVVSQRHAKGLIHEALVDHSKPDLQALRSTRKNVTDSDSRPFQSADEANLRSCSRPMLSSRNVVRLLTIAGLLVPTRGR